jgi:hypothetical protein
MATSGDRRGFQRIKLAQPILGMWNGQNALILDIGMTGAFVEHHGMVRSGTPVTLSFKWQGKDVVFKAEALHSVVVRPPEGERPPASQTGVKFIEAVGDAEERVQDMMVSFVGKVLAAQKANAAADAPAESAASLASIGQARRARTRGFIAFRWNGKAWSRTRTEKPAQPADGFTVAAYEEEEDLDTLCKTYEAADEEGRRLIRLVAELSASTVKS